MNLRTHGRRLAARLRKRLAFIALGAACAAGLGLVPRPAAAQVVPAEAVKTLQVAPGLEASLFAWEPMIMKPADIDVDSRGRVWVCEGVNYRKWSKLRPEGDRIVILEDTRGTGHADKSTVFYQGTDVNCALGICVLGDGPGMKVIVSCSPQVIILTDTTGSGKADKKEVLFSGIAGQQHDHGVHAFTFGPDGKLYFDMGNAAERLKRPDGKPVVDIHGNVVDAGFDNLTANADKSVAVTYRDGMALRCDPDGSNVEVLGNNFRNNYELAVDSFGTLWQSDNDDDGNKGVRINYVMEYGNYGYKDEKTGAGWSSPRTNLEPEIPRRHWHLNDPGVVPTMLLTGQGAPTGMCIYEGHLLPKAFWGQIIHCDAGPNVVRAYPVTADGAGYKADTLNILKGTDKWFRPSDVCVAPDGALIVADWYDPGVGGHGMGDHTYPNMHGRIYRVAPPGNKPTVPTHDLKTGAGAVEALKSPNMATRYLAWTAIHAMGAAAEPDLQKLWGNSDPRMRARALHLLARIDGKAQQYVDAAVKDPEADIRITGLRLARELKLDMIPLVRAVSHDPSAQVRREAIIALRDNKSSEVPDLWADLASQHDGKDRWYLEALGIGEAGRDTDCFAAWLTKVGANWNTPAGRDIVWRSRGANVPGYLAKIILDPATPNADRPRYIRALDFVDGPEKTEVLIAMLKSEIADNRVVLEALTRLKKQGTDVPGLKETITKMLESKKGMPEFVELCEQLDVRDRDAELLELAISNSSDSTGANAARMIVRHNNNALLQTSLAGENAVKLATALGNIQDGSATGLLSKIAAGSKQPLPLRQEAVRGLAKSKSGAAALLALAKKDQLAQDVTFTAGQELRTAQWPEIRSEAIKVIPAPAGKDAQPLPPVAQLIKMPGDATRGHAVFLNTCVKCHKVGNDGVDFAPNLSEIGTKLGKDALCNKVLNPSSSIAFGFEGTVIKLKNKEEVDGIVTSDTAEGLVVKTAGGIVTRYKREDIQGRKQMKISIMPEGLQTGMSTQEFVDLIQFLSEQKKK